MFKIMSPAEAVGIIKDGDCICVNSFVGIENPVELHEAIYERFKETGSPKNLTIVSSAGFGLWDENRNAESYIREGAVDKLICGHFGAMLSTKKLVLEDRFEAYNLPLGCISHAIRAQAGGIPGALSKVGLDIFVDPRIEGPGINNISNDKELVKLVDVDGEEFLYYKLPKIDIALIKGTAADRRGNISFDDMYMSGDALSICQAAKANGGKVIVRKAAEGETEALIAVVGIKPGTLMIGEQMQTEDQDPAQVEFLAGILDQIEGRGLTAHVEKIDFSNPRSPEFSYDNRFTVVLGSNHQLEYKFGMFVSVLEKLKAGDVGVINVSDGSTAHFSPN